MNTHSNSYVMTFAVCTMNNASREVRKNKETIRRIHRQESKL